MMAFIASMCVGLPIVLFPPYLFHKLKIITQVQQQQWSLRAGQFCARWMLRLIPFCRLSTIPNIDQDPQPSIWVCNHVSNLDIFFLLAADKKLRGRNRRPIKIVYVSVNYSLVRFVRLPTYNSFSHTLAIRCIHPNSYSGKDWKRIPLPSCCLLNVDLFQSKWRPTRREKPTIMI